jgi:hypothetical protein
VLGVSPMVFVRAISGVFQAAAVMVAVLVAARLALVDAGLPAGARLCLLIVLGAAVFVPLCAWREPELRRDAQALLERVTKRRARVPSPQPVEA